jgi:hypothetical protein
MCLAAIPLALGLPNKFVLLSAGDNALMLGIAATSFVAQLLSTRGLQIVVAAKAAAMGFTQVCGPGKMVLCYIYQRIYLGHATTVIVAQVSSDGRLQQCSSSACTADCGGGKGSCNGLHTGRWAAGECVVLKHLVSVQVASSSCGTAGCSSSASFWRFKLCAARLSDATGEGVMVHSTLFQFSLQDCRLQHHKLNVKCIILHL